MSKTYIIAEVGINHNGSIENAIKMIDISKDIGADAVKFQKRTIDLVYTKETLDTPRESPWGTTTRQQKEGLELSKDEFKQIDSHCKKLGIDWSASCWDTESQKFIRTLNCSFNKVASAMLSHKKLINLIAEEKKKTFISTGMHTLEEIDKVIDVFDKQNCPYEIMHTVSTYPMKPEDANLRMIETLKKRYNCDVGYSGHENGRAVSVAAVSLGAKSLERHVTLDRTMYGSDQAASLEFEGFKLLINYVRIVDIALGNGEKTILEAEKKIREKLAPIER